MKGAYIKTDFLAREIEALAAAGVTLVKMPWAMHCWMWDGTSLSETENTLGASMNVAPRPASVCHYICMAAEEQDAGGFGLEADDEEGHGRHHGSVVTESQDGGCMEGYVARIQYENSKNEVKVCCPQKHMPNKPKKCKFGKPKRRKHDKPKRCKLDKPKRCKLDKPKRCKLDKPKRCKFDKPEEDEINKPDEDELDTPDEDDWEGCIAPLPGFCPFDSYGCSPHMGGNCCPV
ncbi:hypothetical protein DFQ26_000135 [Actinomortierella ambigua]|nr:hypothetical protein DFQ26_000135 [Actinomortierella ambigua]